jgi:hypothetical protein
MTPIRTLFASAAFLMAVAAAGSALAAPFCVVVAGRADCRYSDPQLCQTRAIAQRGDCLANPNPTRKSYRVPLQPSSYGSGVYSLNFAGHAPYCLVSPTAQSCTFYAEDACGIQAQREGGTCILNPTLR